MPVHISWQQITLRLALTVFAGLAIGVNRGGRGRPAGMRTTLLVCLAASVSMILTNVMMDTAGRAYDSFVMLDLMRLPLGILTGMGFIGAPAILRKGDVVIGVTTAATLWFVTVVGLCIGAGYFGLGLASVALGLATLWGLRIVEGYMRQITHGTLRLTLLNSGPSDRELRDRITRERCVVTSWAVAREKDSPHREIACDIEWKSVASHSLPPSIVDQLLADPAVVKLRWQPQNIIHDGEASVSRGA